jgi:hypothetical protein
MNLGRRGLGSGEAQPLLPDSTAGQPPRADLRGAVVQGGKAGMKVPPLTPAWYSLTLGGAR